MGGVLALAALVVGVFALLHVLLRATPPNAGRLHGGGMDGADAARFGLPSRPAAGEPMPPSPHRDAREKEVNRLMLLVLLVVPLAGLMLSGLVDVIVSLADR